jgi:predicted metal-dependent enzyme (double-stranded beta helix superfamily)
MISQEDFVTRCRTALSEVQPRLAVKEVVEQAVTDGVDGLSDGLSDEPCIRVLACDETLTVAHVVIPGGRPKSLPHDHRMWAVIGIRRGREENEFFRRAGSVLETSGGRVVPAGEVLMLGQEVIHRIQNPLAHESLSALHVYGGDLPGTPRSMWTEPEWTEEPYDERAVTGTTFIRS